MTLAELKAAHDTAKATVQAADEAFTKATPGQAEIVGDPTASRTGVVARWFTRRTIDGGAESVLSIAVPTEVIGDGAAALKTLAPAALRRIADIRDALELWAQDAGPWPLATVVVKADAAPAVSEARG